MDKYKNFNLETLKNWKTTKIVDFLLSEQFEQMESEEQIKVFNKLNMMFDAEDISILFTKLFKRLSRLYKKEGKIVANFVLTVLEDVLRSIEAQDSDVDVWLQVFVEELRDYPELHKLAIEGLEYATVLASVASSNDPDGIVYKTMFEEFNFLLEKGDIETVEDFFIEVFSVCESEGNYECLQDLFKYLLDSELVYELLVLLWENSNIAESVFKYLAKFVVDCCIEEGMQQEFDEDELLENDYFYVFADILERALQEEKYDFVASVIDAYSTNDAEAYMFNKGFYSLLLMNTLLKYKQEPQIQASIGKLAALYINEFLSKQGLDWNEEVSEKRRILVEVIVYMKYDKRTAESLVKLLQKPHAALLINMFTTQQLKQIINNLYDAQSGNVNNDNIKKLISLFLSELQKKEGIEERFGNDLTRL